MMPVTSKRRIILAAAALPVLLAPVFRAAPADETRLRHERQAAEKAVRGNIQSLLNPAQSRSLGGSPAIDRLVGVLRPDQLSLALGRLDSLKRRFEGRHAALLVIGEAYLKLGKDRRDARVKGHLMRAHALNGLGRPREALHAAKSAKKLDPGNGEAVSLVNLISGRVEGGRSGRGRGDPGRGRGFRPHRSLDPRQAASINKALILLGKTESGKDIVMAVAPDSNGVVDLEALQRARVDVRAARRGVLKSPGRVEEARGGERIRFTHIITLDERTIAEHRAALAAQLGHNISDVSFWRRWGDRVSKALMEQVGKVKAVWVSLELKKQGESFPLTTPLAKALSFWTMIWEDDLRNKRWTNADTAVYGKHVAKQFDQALKREYKRGVRGSAAFWWLVSGDAKRADMRNIGSKQHAYKMAVRDPVVRHLTQDDADFRAKNGYPPLRKE